MTCQDNIHDGPSPPPPPPPPHPSSSSEPPSTLQEDGISWVANAVSWVPGWADFSLADFNQVRGPYPPAQSFDPDDGRTAFSDICSHASGLSPQLEPFSSPQRYVGNGVDINLFDDDLWGAGDQNGELQLPAVALDTRVALNTGWLSYSPSGALGQMSIAEDFEPIDGDRRAWDMDDYSQSAPVKDAMVDVSASGPYRLEDQSAISNSVYLPSENTTFVPNSLSILPVPPVTISPCPRPSTPDSTLPPQLPPTGPSPSPRKRHYLDSATTTGSRHHRNSWNLDVSCIPSPHSPLSPSRPIRRASSRLQKNATGKSGKRNCPHCPDPSIFKPGQKHELVKLPPELLIEIFIFACSSLPARRTWICEHQKADGTDFGLPRRSTTSGAYLGNDSNQSSSSSQQKWTLPRRLRLLQARTIRSIQLTCRTFNRILMVHPNVDDSLWRAATIGCWGHLPKTLVEVQGWSKTSQTCWRNVFGVFMRSDNGMFNRRSAGGVGGVESFGGKNGFKGAILWDEEKKSRERQMQEKEEEEKGRLERYMILESKGKRRQTDEEGMDVEDPAKRDKRKLRLACTQPGPDVFTVTPSERGEEAGYEIGLVLQHGENVFVHLDQYGNFSPAKWMLPHELRRSKKGRFQPDCFEVIGDRFGIVKVQRPGETPSPNHFHGNTNQGSQRLFEIMKPIVTWDLQCLPEYFNDKRASVARCVSKNGYLVFNIFASREGFIEGLDRPEEDHRVFCVLAVGQEGCNPIDEAGVSPDEYRAGTWRRPMTKHPVETAGSATKGKGKMSPSEWNISGPSYSWSSHPPKTIFRWQRTFVHPNANNYPIEQRLHYNICNLKVNSTYAVILIRWNVHSRVSYHEFVDRSFQVLDLATGTTIRTLQFPNFHWDFRHHDMTAEYNVMRYYKMRRIYNAKNAENRATRIHEDEFTLDEKGRLVCGSHDYCNWVWDLNKEYDEEAQSRRVFNPLRNDAGKNDPFLVLDDFYWDREKQCSDTEEREGEAWDTNNERAGWWVRTPNQVLCFWHNITTSQDGRWFAAVRAGRMFVWDLENITNVQGFSCALGTYTGNNLRASGKDTEAEAYPARPQPTVDDRYLGKVLNPRLEKELKSWHVWNGIIPAQGLWLMYDDGKVVYLDRDDVLDACGLAQLGKDWGCSLADFGTVDTESEGSSDDDDREGEEEDEEDGGVGHAVVVVDDDNYVLDQGFRGGGGIAVPPHVRRKRRRTMPSTRSRPTSFAGQLDELAVDGAEQFMFQNELPDADTWEEMDDEGWLKRGRGCWRGTIIGEGSSAV